MASMVKLLKNAWDFRPFILSSIINENKISFANSKLGWFWIFISPLAQAAVLALVLSKILNAKFPGIDSEFAFAIYLLAGTLAWSLFSETVIRLSTVFIDNANLIKKIRFPKVALPFIVLGSVLINHLALLVCTVFIYLLMGHMMSSSFLLIPLVIFVNLLFSVGLGLILGIFNVFLRDIGKAVPILLQLTFWTTPIVYHIDLLPESFQSIIRLNPMVYVVRGYQDILAYDSLPNFQNLAVLLVLGVVLLFLSLFLYKRSSSDVVDAL